MEIAEQDGGLGAGDDENDKDQEKKSVHVVNLGTPDAVQHEEQLNEDATKGEDSSHHNTGNRLGVHALVGDLPRDLVGPHRVLDGPLPEPEERADKGQGHRHPEPQGQQGHQREEGDRCAGPLVPQDQVHDEEVSKYNAGTKH